MNLLLTVFTFILLYASAGSLQPRQPLERLVEPYRQDIVRWEIDHFLDKWWQRARSLPFGGNPSAEERLEATREFFALGDELRSVNAGLERAVAASPSAQTNGAVEMQAQAAEIRRRRDELRPLVEETLEAAISSAAEEMGIITRLGPLRWPPVDFTFEPGALLLARSPRDEIRRLKDVLLRPDVELFEQIALEEATEETEEVAALVVRIGGVATYPAQVTPNTSLHGTLILASHEWMHHWLIFRPLGRTWFEGGDMTSINETVADIVSEEMGDLAYTKLTGQPVNRPPWQPPSLQPSREPEPGVFDFRREMQATRVRLEALLAEGRVDDAEAYLEERRLQFVANGHYIRKLNTAYFAFYGTYGDSPASISPIAAQLRTVRGAAPSLAAFVGKVSRITTPPQLEAMAREAGWGEGGQSER